MGSDHGTIDEMDVPVKLALGIGLRLHRRQELVPDTCPLPTIEAAGHGPPGAIALRQIAPRRAGAQHPADAIDDGAMVMGGSPRLGLLGWKERLEPLPVAVGQVDAVHVVSPPFLLESIARHDQSLQTRPSRGGFL